MKVVIAIAEGRDARRALVPAIHARQIAAIVQERPTAPRPTERVLRGHMAALERLEALGLTILPVRFGTTAKTAADVRRLLTPHVDALADALTAVRGRRQMTVRVRGERTPLRAPSGARYLDARAAAARVSEADPVRRAVKRFIVEERVDASGRRGFLGAVYHLIDADHVDRYREAYKAVARRHPARFSVSGPAMPFAFVPSLAADETE